MPTLLLVVDQFLVQALQRNRPPLGHDLHDVLAGLGDAFVADHDKSAL
jgi:hypothetical protein